jgi:hypothetical protein
MYNLSFTTGVTVQSVIMLDWIQLPSSLDLKGFVAENNTTFRLKDVKELVYGEFGRITKEVWAKDLFIKFFFIFKGLKRNVVF